MDKRINIGIVGDYSGNIYTHVALNESVAHARPQLQFQLETEWIPTEKINIDWLTTHPFDGFWIAPGSPYTNDAGVFELIRWCRENDFPLLATCGGFQYMVVEFARNFLGFDNAGHEETDPQGRFVISRLACSMKGQKEEVEITDNQSWLYDVLRKDKIWAYYNCSYGVNPIYTKTLNQYPMVFTAFNKDGEPRALEFKAHRFFCGTLFQPPLDSSVENPNPLLVSFFQKCAG
jgi:CTP synthase (UTP-ammonia lyase)